VRRRFESQTRSGRIGDALLDLLYGAVVVAGGLFLGVLAMLAADEEGGAGAWLGLVAAGLIFVGGLYLLLRAIRGRRPLR
jgi:hypothetical protein